MFVIVVRIKDRSYFEDRKVFIIYSTLYFRMSTNLIRKFLCIAESGSFFNKGVPRVERKKQNYKLFPKSRTPIVSKIYLKILKSST